MIAKQKVKSIGEKKSLPYFRRSLQGVVLYNSFVQFQGKSFIDHISLLRENVELGVTEI